MEHGKVELKNKLREIYPAIDEHSLELDVEYKPEKEYWIVKLQRGDFKLHTFLDKEDADACLEGTQCVYLGVQISEFVSNFKVAEKKKKMGL